MPRLLHRLLLCIVLVNLLVGCTIDEAPTPPNASAPKATRTVQPAAQRPTKAPAKTPQPATGRQAAWTILVYMAADNDLESFAIADFLEMARVGSNDDLNIIVQMDRIAGDGADWDDESNGDWDSVKRFRVESKMKPTPKAALADLGESDSGDPKVLADFVTWGMQTYPAQHTALIFWDHGAAWPGVASDDSSDGDLLSLPEIGAALGKAKKQIGFDRMALIGFDACLMSQIDVLRTVRDYGEVAIGSADLEPGDGWAWTAWLGQLAKNPQMDGAAIAPEIVKSFISFYRAKDEPTVTLAAFDLRKLDTVTDKLNVLATTMIKEMPDAYKAIARARSYAIKYDPDDENELSAIDLGHFAKLLTKQRASRTMARAAQDLLDAISSTRIAWGSGKAYKRDGTGLSIYFPRKDKYFTDDYLKESPLAEATEWDEFLRAFYRGPKAKAQKSLVSEPTLSADTTSMSAPVTVSSTISGEDTAYVSSFIGTIDPATSSVLFILKQDYVYPPGTRPNGDVPDWPAEATDVAINWRATSWYISNGSDTVEVALSPIRYGSNVYSVEGTYTVKKTGKTRDASLYFELDGERGRLLRVWGFDPEHPDATPAELTPRAGDTFTPAIPTLNFTPNGDTEEDVADGDPITFGKEPLVALEGAAPSGSYVIGLLVENVAGDISETYSDVTVDNTGAVTVQPDAPAPAAPVAGAQPGTLAYQSDALGFTLDYPQDWQPFDLGDDQVAFANPDDESGAYLSASAYALEGTPAAASNELLQSLLDDEAKQTDFAQQGQITNMPIAGGTGKSVEYTYTDEDGVASHVLAVAYADKKTDMIYMLIAEAPTSSYETTLANFTQIIDSFQLKTP